MGKIYSHSHTCLIIGFCIVLGLSCGDRKNRYADTDIADFAELKALVESHQFAIVHDWAQPMSMQNVNLIGNPNFIRFSGDSVSLFLPYFGERYSGGGYGGDGGISFRGVPESFDILENKEDRNIQIHFKASEDTENYDIRITLFSNGKVSTSVSSSQRAPITYRGSVLEESTKESLNE